MRALDRKLLRDLSRLRGQVLAVALVVASGVAVLVMSLTSIEALEETAEAYYEAFDFADVFAVLTRAPERIAVRAAEIDGVRTVETRIVETATLDVPGFGEPVVGQLVSLPERGAARLNRLAVRQGRLAEPGRSDEVVLAEPFAEAHGLRPGDTLAAILNGRKRTLRVVGTALSPEYVYALGPGQLMPDEKRFGVLWMGRGALEAAFDLDGAFNEISLALMPDARTPTVIAALDRLLEPYGGLGAYARAEQLSNWFLMNEIAQLRSMARILPTIFLVVAAFLTHMVLARLIATERAEIGLMKAFGYSNLEVGWHYAKLVILMTGIGILLGWAAGAWLGRYNTEVYAQFYRFPFLYFRPGPSGFAIAAVVSLGAALAGSLGAVSRAARLPPAEAMRPPAPPRYRKTRLHGPALERWIDQPTRIFLRQLARWPVRSALTVSGIGMSVAVLVTSMQWLDAIDRMVDITFHEQQRLDMTVGFAETKPRSAVWSFERLPGVLAAEPGRYVAVTFHAGPRTHRGGIQGIVEEPRLNLLYDVERGAVAPPPEGLLLSSTLARKLGVDAGDLVRVEVREGRRPVHDLPVTAIIETFIGTPAYMRIGALDRLMREGPRAEQVHLLVDPLYVSAIHAELKELPAVAGVTIRKAAVQTFHQTLGDTLLIYVSFFVVFACTLAFGVVYNSARISLSERGRELATLRVLGFTRGEIAYILLGEVAVLVFLALPAGCIAGYGLAALIVAGFETELFRVPLVVAPATYGWAVLIGLAATAASAYLVRWRLDRLDLISVLKTRE
ncbi:ABC transporter permease [Futiania mangrovi]|uniref:FtsX-like permease family protein n=1 Tax=Futiania mangrovi TaxID=2959716 RepID=A0A9J6PDH6_9PROT|nr:FtsX-like permease family protein [Futiania mangrovii]MCP1335763.1 FtsX-like permease family protein [Futiania mangrovii]